MKWIVILIVFLSGCSDSSADKNKDVQKSEIKVEKIDHYYALRDGFMYGYENAITENDAAQGKAVKPLLMFRYSGMIDDTYQVYSKDDQFGAITVIECKNPCAFVKIVTHIRGIKTPKTEHMRMVPGTIAYAVLSDAINRKLDPVILDNNGKKASMWITEKGDLLQSLI